MIRLLVSTVLFPRTYVGFGVCCVFVTEECGGDLSYNNSYIQNPGYPMRSTAADTCTWNINKMSDDICFIRIDFETSELQGVEQAPNGVCSLDSIEFT